MSQGGRPGCWSHAYFKDGTCKACSSSLGNTSGTRLRRHLAMCTKVDEGTRKRAQESFKAGEKRRAEEERAPAAKISRSLGAVPVPLAGELRGTSSRGTYLCRKDVTEA